jgi:4-hydroxy-tetrahydrodipicolinate synthase
VALGGILTAMVTPFDTDGGVDEDAFVRLLHHLLENGSDGVVVAGTTGEGSTLDDAEKLRLFELAVAEAGEATVVAGTGSNDTAHSVHLTEKAHAAGVDAMLVVVPYYNKPNWRGIKAHYEAVAAATDKPIVVYNIPGRSVIDLSNDQLAELAQIENVSAVKQARFEDVASIPGMDLLTGNDDMLAEVLDAGGTGGICVASHLVGAEMRRMIDEPDHRNEIHDSLREVYKATFVAPPAVSVKAALDMLGICGPTVRLPYVEASEDEAGEIRAVLERHGLLSAV